MADMMLRALTNSPARGSDNTLIQLRGTRDGSAFFADWLVALAMEGRVYFASDADQNDEVVGQTSFANTTPTFLLNVPTNTTAIPLYMNLAQVDPVAGGAIDVIIEIDNIAAYSSGGTSETVLSARTDHPIANGCALYSGATATAGYGVAVEHIMQIPQDVVAAVGDDYRWHQIKWKPPVPIFLVGPASLKVFTYAATTGPSWNWSFAWAEVPSSSIT